jgi:hypothetical protein
MEKCVSAVIDKILYTPQNRALKGITIRAFHLKLLKTDNTSGKDLNYFPEFKLVPHGSKGIDGYEKQSAANTTANSTVTENSAPSPAESFSYYSLIYL